MGKYSVLRIGKRQRNVHVGPSMRGDDHGWGLRGCQGVVVPIPHGAVGAYVRACSIYSSESTTRAGLGHRPWDSPRTSPPLWSRGSATSLHDCHVGSREAPRGIRSTPPFRTFGRRSSYCFSIRGSRPSRFGRRRRRHSYCFYMRGSRPFGRRRPSCFDRHGCCSYEARKEDAGAIRKPCSALKRKRVEAYITPSVNMS